MPPETHNEAQTLTMRVAAEIRAEVARQRVTHRELGRRINLSQPQVTRRLNGRLAMDTAELERIAQALGVSVDRFLPRQQSKARAA